MKDIIVISVMIITGISAVYTIITHFTNGRKFTIPKIDKKFSMDRLSDIGISMLKKPNS